MDSPEWKSVILEYVKPYSTRTCRVLIFCLERQK